MQTLVPKDMIYVMIYFLTFKFKFMKFRLKCKTNKEIRMSLGLLILLTQV